VSGDPSLGGVPPDETLASGTRVGDFVIDGPLGTGAFGQVYAATHHLIGKAAAVKVLARRYSGDPQVVSRFMAEARAVNAIAHRNIVDIFDFGTLDDGRPFFIMEFLDGEPLDVVIRRDGSLVLADVEAIARGLGRALDAAHAKGVIHRDLKPANVFLLRDDEGRALPKLLDFGIAKLVDAPPWSEHQTQTGAAIGTPAYMSPEQCLGQPIDHRTDVYALGVLFYQLLTGRLPFHAESTVELLMKHVAEPPPRPSSVRPGLPAAADEALHQLLAKERDQRPASAGAAVDLLLGALADASEARPPFDPPELGPTADPTGYAPTLASGSRPDGAGSGPPPAGPRLQPGRLAFAVLLLAGATVAGTWLVGRPRPAGPPAADAVSGSRAGAASTEVGARAADEEAIPAPPSATIRVRVRGEPEGARIIDAHGETIGAVPAEIDIARGDVGIRWRVEADGFVPTTHTFTPNEDLELDVELERVPAPRRRSKPPAKRERRPGRNALEDPFQ
jgi:serine/threonine-protein kinase